MTFSEFFTLAAAAKFCSRILISASSFPFGGSPRAALESSTTNKTTPKQYFSPPIGGPPFRIAIEPILLRSCPSQETTIPKACLRPLTHDYGERFRRGVGGVKEVTSGLTVLPAARSPNLIRSRSSRF